jgi:hypothetical protein
MDVTNTHSPTAIRDLVFERAATVAGLTAVDRPKSTVAHHVNVLMQAGCSARDLDDNRSTNDGENHLRIR